jgi:hypothetical protein
MVKHSLSLMELHTPSLKSTLNSEAVEHDRHTHTQPIYFRPIFHTLRSRKYYFSLQFSHYNFVYIFVSPCAQYDPNVN